MAKVTPSHEEMAERVRDLATKLHTSAQVDAIRALAAKFGAEDGAGQALSLVTAAVAVTVTECARRATITPYLEERQLELTSLNILAKASTKLTRAWDAHANRDKNEVNVRDVNIAPGAQAVVGVVGLAATPAAAPPDPQIGTSPSEPAAAAVNAQTQYWPDALEPSLQGGNTLGWLLPVARSARQAALSYAWRRCRIRRAVRQQKCL